MYYLKDIISDSIVPLIPIILLGSRYKKLSAALKLIFYYLLITVLIFSVSNILADDMINNLFLYHIYTVVNFGMLLFYLQLVYFLFSKNTIISILILFVSVCCVFNSIFIEKIDSLDINANILTNSILVLFCLAGFIKSIRNQYLLEHLGFYNMVLTFGIFVYSASSIIVYSYFKYMTFFGQRISNAVWFLHDDILILKYCCFIIAGILCIKKL